MKHPSFSAPVIKGYQTLSRIRLPFLKSQIPLSIILLILQNRCCISAYLNCSSFKIIYTNTMPVIPVFMRLQKSRWILFPSVSNKSALFFEQILPLSSWIRHYFSFLNDFFVFATWFSIPFCVQICKISQPLSKPYIHNLFTAATWFVHFLNRFLIYNNYQKGVRKWILCVQFYLILWNTSHYTKFFFPFTALPCVLDFRTNFCRYLIFCIAVLDFLPCSRFVYTENKQKRLASDQSWEASLFSFLAFTYLYSSVRRDVIEYLY